MIRSLTSLAFQGMTRKKRSSILIFAVLLISFAFSIVSLSLVGSISKTNAEFRLNAYGEWYFAIPSGLEEDGAWLESQPWADTVGKSEGYGVVETPTGSIGFGTMDPSLIRVGRIALDAGLFPTEDNEIAMEADVLDALGVSHELGQEITLQINIPCTVEDTVQYIPVEQSFRLCGVLREYTDLWVLNRNSDQRLLIGAVVTDSTAQGVLETAKSYVSESTETAESMASIPQYFISVREADRDTARTGINDRLSHTRIGDFGDGTVCENKAAYPGSEAETHDQFYVYIIAAVTMVAVLCVYMMQMPREIHSFAVLRSIGITKMQMALLLLMETLFLIVPAILLGIPCGAGLTWLALRLMLYSGSVPIQVAVPYDALLTVIGLWMAAVLLSRLVMFGVTMRTSLTGRMNLQGSKKRWASRLRNGLVILLVSAFGAVSVYTVMESMAPSYKREYWSLCPSYTIWGKGTVSQTNTDLIRKVPGVARVDGFGEMQIVLSFNGLEERTVWLYAIDEEGWTETLDFGENKDAFHRGELVLLCLPEAVNEEYAIPQGEITLRVYNNSSEPIAEDSTQAVVTRIPERVMNRGLHALWEPYTIFCSESYLKSLLASMEQGQQWDKYVAGEEFGYDRVYVSVDLNSDNLSTDLVMSSLCKEHGLSFDNRRREFQAMVQEQTQTLILLYSSCACIALVVLLILVGALSLETEHEKTYWGILRAIGLSKRQMRLRIFAKAFWRGALAVAVGWILYGGYAVTDAMEHYPAFSDALASAISSLTSYEGCLPRAVMVSVTCLVVPMVISLWTKRKIGKGDLRQ